MPYIEKQQREDYVDKQIETPGVLSYALSQEIRYYLFKKPLSYALLNDVVGVLECLKQEFIRQKLNPYEDQKRKENGDIW